MCAWEVRGTLASGLDVASAGPAAFSAGHHFSDLSAPPGRVLTTRPLHGTSAFSSKVIRIIPLRPS